VDGARAGAAWGSAGIAGIAARGRGAMGQPDRRSRCSPAHPGLRLAPPWAPNYTAHGVRGGRDALAARLAATTSPSSIGVAGQGLSGRLSFPMTDARQASRGCAPSTAAWPRPTVGSTKPAPVLDAQKAHPLRAVVDHDER
jgi:hypothetical protein